ITISSRRRFAARLNSSVRRQRERIGVGKAVAAFKSVSGHFVVVAAIDRFRPDVVASQLRLNARLLPSPHRSLDLRAGRFIVLIGKQIAWLAVQYFAEFLKRTESDCTGFASLQYR